VPTSAGAIVVTGAASGIGRRAAVQLAAAGRRVVVVTRSDERARPVVAEGAAAARDGGSVTSVPADLADLSAVRRAVERIVDTTAVDAVISNAAVLAVARQRPVLTVDGIEEVFAVNHVASFVLTTGLLEHMDTDGRVVVAGSKGLMVVPWLRLDLDDLDSRRRWSSTRAYYRSKLAQLLFVAELRRRSVTAVALRIPSVRLDDERLARYPRALRIAYRPKQRLAADPTDVAGRYVELALGPVPAGGHVDEHGREVGWPNGTDDAALARTLWDVTERLARGAG
jgi:NAD(P)-dependent dehydrogenase (short-subunit alcohol dehydrogenase family)